MKFHVATVTSKSSTAVPYLPGALLVLAGLMILVAPRLLIAAVAFVLLVGGLLLCFFAWKVRKFTKTVTRLAEDMEGRVLLQTFQVGTRNDDVEVVDEKKIIVH